MAISASGGAQFSAGTDAGRFEPRKVFIFKYGTQVQGTLNNKDDIDTGYSIELALPWSLIRTKAPAVGDMMSFNIIVRRHGGKPGDFVSLSSSVKTEQDALDPSKWGNVVLATYAFVAVAPGSDKIVCGKSVVRPPLIDGTVDEREWPKNCAFNIDLPLPTGFVYEAKYPIQRTVFTIYGAGLQRDPRKPATYTKLSAADGGIELADFPAENVGPWVSSDRVQYHKQQLSDMVAAGVDVVLPIYWGDSRRSSLARLVSALEELRVEGKQYPKVAMLLYVPWMFDRTTAGPSVEETSQRVYALIRSFYDIVPPEHRAVAPSGKPNLGKPGVIVHMQVNAKKLPPLFGPDLLTYCSERFEADFGCPIVWGGSEVLFGVKGLDSIVPLSWPPESLTDKLARISAACVTAGELASPASSDRPDVVCRMGGESYDKAWADILDKMPYWVFCDKWDDFSRGSEICASREYGRKYIDATAAKSRRFHGEGAYRTRYLRYDVPKVIAQGRVAQALVTLRNVGDSPWRTSEGISISYRWYKNGRFVCETDLRRPIDHDVMPGTSITLSFGVATATSHGDPIADGDYELRIELIRMADAKWFSGLGDQPLMAPVTVGPTPEWGAAYLSCDAPIMAAAGQSYPVEVQVRNDGSKVWAKGAVKLGCRLYRIPSAATGSPEESPLIAARALLAKDCKPGELATFLLDLDLSQPDRKPIPLSGGQESWRYQLRFDIHNGAQWLSESGVRTLNRAVEVYEADWGPRIVDSNVPPKLAAGQMFDAKVVVRNNGVYTWDRKRVGIGYHWYHLDGNQMQWDCPRTPISADIKPGWPAVFSGKIKAPEYDGQYVLAWDVMADGTWLSTLPITRGGDMLPVFVEVTGGKLAFVDLSGLFDTVASSPDTARNLGDFDGKGSSFPAEHMPPDVGVSEQASRVYPSGYKWDQETRSDGRISFAYPDKTPGLKDAVSCQGQKVVVERASYLALHVLAASSDGDMTGEFSVNYENGSDAKTVKVSDWGAGPKNGEEVGCAVRHRHSHGGDEIGKYAYLYHYSIPLNGSRTVTSVTLPRNPKIKIMAVTLERVSLPPSESGQAKP